MRTHVIAISAIVSSELMPPSSSFYVDVPASSYIKMSMTPATTLEDAKFHSRGCDNKGAFCPSERVANSCPHEVTFSLSPSPSSQSAAPKFDVGVEDGRAKEPAFGNACEKYGDRLLCISAETREDSRETERSDKSGGSAKPDDQMDNEQRCADEQRRSERLVDHQHERLQKLNKELMDLRSAHEDLLSAFSKEKDNGRRKEEEAEALMIELMGHYENELEAANTSSALSNKPWLTRGLNIDTGDGGSEAAIDVSNIMLCHAIMPIPEEIEGEEDENSIDMACGEINEAAQKYMVIDEGRVGTRDTIKQKSLEAPGMVLRGRRRWTGESTEDGTATNRGLGVSRNGTDYDGASDTTLKTGQSMASLSTRSPHLGHALHVLRVRSRSRSRSPSPSLAQGAAHRSRLLSTKSTDNGEHGEHNDMGDMRNQDGGTHGRQFRQRVQNGTGNIRAEMRSMANVLDKLTAREAEAERDLSALMKEYGNLSEVKMAADTKRDTALEMVEELKRVFIGTSADASVDVQRNARAAGSSTTGGELEFSFRSSKGGNSDSGEVRHAGALGEMDEGPQEEMDLDDGPLQETANGILEDSRQQPRRYVTFPDLSEMCSSHAGDDNDSNCHKHVGHNARGLERGGRRGWRGDRGRHVGCRGGRRGRRAHHQHNTGRGEDKLPLKEDRTMDLVERSSRRRPDNDRQASAVEIAKLKQELDRLTRELEVA